MTKNAYPQKPDSIYSDKMDSSLRSDAVVSLGKKLVDELGLVESVDTLGRWMSHHLAELILRAEDAPPETRAKMDKECFDAIIDLWRHRAELPQGKRPFEDLEPVVRAVESLDPENEYPRYFRFARQRKLTDGEESEVNEWLEAADGIDHSARILIGYCLSKAAERAVNQSEEWVTLAKAAGMEDGPFEVVVRYVSSDVDLKSESDKKADEYRQKITDRIKRLDGFVKLSRAISKELKAGLAELNVSNVDSTGSAAE